MLKLEIEHKVLNRDNYAYNVLEINKAKQTIKELFKNKEKYKKKILALSQHINLLRNEKLNENVIFYLSKKEKGFTISEKINTKAVENGKSLHKIVIQLNDELKEIIRDRRFKSRVIPDNFLKFKDMDLRRIGNKKVGYVHDKPKSILKVLRTKKLVNLEKPKFPFSNENHIGVEIEFASFLNKTQIGELFLDADLIDYVQLHHEYINGKHTSENEYELCVIAPENKIKDIIQNVCKILNEKIDANVTYGCGLHIHLDARNRNIKKMYDNLFNCQEILYSMVAFIRRENKHVRMMPKKLWYPFKNDKPHSQDCKNEVCKCKFEKGIIDNGYRDVGDRFYGINTWSYMAHKTLEVRIHSGTTNATKINNWIDLLLKIIETKPINRPIEAIDEFKHYVKLDEKLLNYVEKRIENFK
jgi:hypothetical protein